MSKAKGYIRAVVEMEFDKGDTVDVDTVYEYIHNLMMDGTLSVDFFDKDNNRVEV